MSDNPYKSHHVATERFRCTSRRWLLPRLIVGYLAHVMVFAAYLYLHAHHSSLALKPYVREAIDMFGIWGYATIACALAIVPLIVVLVVGGVLQAILKDAAILERQFWFDVFVGALVGLDLVLGRLVV